MKPDFKSKRFWRIEKETVQNYDKFWTKDATIFWLKLVNNRDDDIVDVPAEIAEYVYNEVSKNKAWKEYAAFNPYKMPLDFYALDGTEGSFPDISYQEWLNERAKRIMRGRILKDKGDYISLPNGVDLFHEWIWLQKVNYMFPEEDFSSLDENNLDECIYKCFRDQIDLVITFYFQETDIDENNRAMFNAWRFES